MKIDIPGNSLQRNYFFQNLIFLIPVRKLHKSVHKLLKLLILTIQRRLIIKERSLPAQKVISRILGQPHTVIVPLKAGKHNINGQKTPCGGDSLAHSYHRQTCYLIRVGGRNINVSVRGHCTLVIITFLYIKIFQSLNPGIVGYHLRTAHSFSVDLNIFMPVQIRQAVHKRIQSLPKLLQGDAVLLSLLHIFDTDSQNGLACTDIALLC